MTLITKNKKAYFDYEIIKSYEAGVVLKGSEVKSIKLGNCNLKGSHVIIKNSEVFVTGIHIGTYKFNSQEILDQKRDRKILLHRKNISSLETKLKEKGFAIIPTRVYLKNNLIKIEVSLAKGRKQYDKREVLKKRDLERKDLINFKI